MNVVQLTTRCFQELKSIFETLDGSLSLLNQETIEITEIPAPPFNEQIRGRWMHDKFVEIGYDAYIDEIGNVIASKLFESKLDPIIISAHLDTVFPNASIEVEKDGHLLKAPGVGDDSRGLAVLLQLARIMFKMKTTRQIIYICTVGEEGKGDLRGVKHLFTNDEHASIQNPFCFISVDGTETSRVVNQGIGSKRYKLSIRGPGGHSFGEFGTVNPSYPLGEILYNLSKIKVPDHPKTTYSVGVIGGGTSINSIPEEVWAEIDLRSETQTELQDLDKKLHHIVAEATKRETNTRADSVTSELKVIGERPPGQLDEHSSLHKIIETAHQVMNLDLTFVASSTDANVPLSINIPAIAIASVENSGRAHSQDEWIDAGITSLLPIRRNLLLLYTLANYT